MMKRANTTRGETCESDTNCVLSMKCVLDTTHVSDKT